MHIEEFVDVLSETELFAGLDDDEIVNMVKCLEPRIHNYKKNQYIAIAGEEFKGIGIILEGEAAAYKENVAGTRVMMTLLAPGDVFGEIVAFSSQSNWPVTVEAQQQCKALFISRKNCGRMQANVRGIEN